jgi:3-oxoacyl-[acyl-carrier protein] reductase
MSLELNKSAVVTGGGTGIGKAVAKELIADGYRVVITGRRREVLAETATEIGASAVAFDATDPAQIQSALAELPETVHVLVNNAGGNTDIGRARPHGLAAVRESWLANFEANVLGAVLVTTALSDRIADNGRVINLSSIAVQTGSDGYGAAKAGIETWNIQLARELGARGVTANVISPGFIDDTEFFGGGLPAERRMALVEQTTNKRAGTPRDIAALAGFLASERSGHITGQVIPVNGGARR